MNMCALVKSWMAVPRAFALLCLVFAFASCSQVSVKGIPDNSALVVFKGEIHVKNEALFGVKIGAEFVRESFTLVNLQAHAGEGVVGQRVFGALTGDLRQGYFVFDNVKPGEYRVGRLGYEFPVGRGRCTLAISPSANAYRQNPGLTIKVEPGKIAYIGHVVLDSNRQCDSDAPQGFQMQTAPQDEKAVLTALAKQDALKTSPWLAKINARIAELN